MRFAVMARITRNSLDPTGLHADAHTGITIVGPAFSHMHPLSGPIVALTRYHYRSLTDTSYDHFRSLVHVLVHVGLPAHTWACSSSSSHPLHQLVFLSTSLSTLSKHVSSLQSLSHMVYFPYASTTQSCHATPRLHAQQRYMSVMSLMDSSIVRHSMQDGMWMFVLMTFENWLDLFIQVVCGSYRLCQIEDRFTRRYRFFVVILDLDIDDMYWSIQLGASAEQVLADGIEAPFFARDDDVGCILSFLPTLRCAFDVFVSIQHGHKTVGPVQTRIFRIQIRDDVCVRRSKRVDVGEVDFGSR